MDDHKFDNIIKGKVGEYEEPVFDPSALGALHHQLGAINFSPWYSPYRTELLIGTGIALSTFIIIWTLWFLNSKETQVLEKNALLFRTQQDQIITLQQEIDYLKRRPADTVHIIRMKDETSRILTRISELESIIQKMKTDLAVRTSMPDLLFLAEDSSINPAVKRVNHDYLNLFGLRVKPHPENNATFRADARNVQEVESPQLQFSAKTLRTLEKHYRNGIGIRLGPAVEISGGLYDGGTGRFDISGGVLGDFILSPSVSIETGAKFAHRFYEIGGEELSSSNIRLPQVNPDLAPIITADIDSWMFEIPVNLKYRYPLSMKTHWLAGIGYSSVVYTKQLFEYDYILDGSSSAHINEAHSFVKTKLFPGTLNVSLGLSNRLKNNKIIETSLYYQHGLGETGLEKMNADFVGLKSVYWFTIR